MSRRKAATRRRSPRTVPSLAGSPAISHALLMPAMVAILAVVLIQAVVGINPSIYLDFDPRFEPMAVPITVLGPSGSALLNCISIALAALGLAAHIAAGGRIRWWSSLFVLAGCSACACHLPDHMDNLFRCGQWIAAACLGLAGLHLAEHEGPRRLVAAALAALIVPLAIDAVWYVAYEHRLTVTHFLENEEAFLRSKAWTKGSPHHQLFVRRMMGNDVTGAFALSNVFGSIAAAATMAGGALAAAGARSRRWARSVLPVILTCLGLLCIYLSRSKGAAAAAVAGFALIAAVHWARRRRPGTSGPRLLGHAAVVLVVLAMAAVMVRGSMGPPKSVEGERSILFRYHYWLAAGRTIEAAPIPQKLVGVGPAGFRQAYFLHKEPENPEEVTSAHNAFIDYSTMLGLGGVLWCAVLVGWLWCAGRHAELEPDTEGVPPHTRGAAATEIHPTQLAWAGLLALPVFLTELILEIPKMLFVERMLLWIAGVVGFVAVVTVLLDPRRFGKQWLSVGMFAAAAVLLIHGQIEMTFFHQGAVAIAWLLMGVAAARPTDRAGPRRDVARISFVVPALLLVGAACIFATQMPRLLKHQGALAAASTALRGHRMEDALGDLDRAIDALPTNPRPYRWQASLRLQHARALMDVARPDAAEQQVDHALRRLDRAEQVGLDDPGLLRTRSRVEGRAAEWLGDPIRFQTALRLTRELLERRPYSLQDHLSAADLHWKAGDFEQARTYYHRSLELSDQSRLDPARQMLPHDRERVEERLKE